MRFGFERWIVTLALGLGSCASTNPVRGASEEEIARLDATEDVDAALIASGFETASSLKSARTRFEELVAPIVAQVKGVADPRERARALLAALHQKGSLLGEYDARATTLEDILENRRYNCVSASVVYNLLSARVDLEVSAQLLPTHARSLVKIPREKPLVTVETTSPEGFDPDPRSLAQILAQVGGSLGDGRALVPERGSIVPTRVLLGAIYVNRASVAQEAGDLERAEQLFGRSETYAGTPEMLGLLRDQRAALLSQLAANDLLSEEPARVDRAFATIKAAMALEPKDPSIRAALRQNLRATAERKIALLADRKDEKGMLAVTNEVASLGLEAGEATGLRAFALSEIARLRIDTSEFERAVEVLDLALKEPLTARDAKLKKALENNRVSALRLAAITAAKHGEYARSLAFLDRIRTMPGLSAEQRGDTKGDHLRVIHLVGNKRIDENDFRGALDVYRDGVRLFPGDATCRHNLVAVLERLVLPLAQQGECAKTEDYLEEIRALDPESRFPGDVRVRCLMERATARLEAKDFAEAVSLMRAARDASPAEKAVVENLAVALLRWTVSLSSSGSCAKALNVARELRKLDEAKIEDGEIRRALGTCRD